MALIPDPQRRSHERIPFAQTAWTFALFFADGASPIDTPIELEPQNIGEGGIKFMSNKRFPIFQELSIKLFELGDEGGALHLPGKIVRVEEIDVGGAAKTYGIAVAFHDVDSATAGRLNERLAVILSG